MINVKMAVDIAPMWYAAKSLLSQVQKVDKAQVSTIGKPQFKTFVRDRMLPIAEAALEKSRKIILASMPGGKGNIYRAAQINNIKFTKNGITIGMFDSRKMNMKLKRPTSKYQYYWELQEFGSVSTKPYLLSPQQRRIIAWWYAANKIPQDQYRLQEAPPRYARPVKGKFFIKAAADHLAKNMSKLQNAPTDYLRMLSSTYARKKNIVSRLEKAYWINRLS